MKICVNQLFMLLVNLLINNRLLGVNLSEVESCMWIFHCAGGLHPGPPTPTLFQSQLCFHFVAKSEYRNKYEGGIYHLEIR